ncbi:MAG: metalloregulator ArsR/SmtB family transcription factor [Candidatus Marsarchaeota archaeon]|nr:metalloregulator ArsR/SmtB family transcription factor [Candidatus Marsarchaeota archaeon]
MNSSDNVLVFKALANSVRLKIIDTLLDGPKSVESICIRVGEAQSRVSHELFCLRNCGFVKPSRSGKMIIYELNKASVMPILSAANKHASLFCKELKSCNILSEIKENARSIYNK